MKSQTPFRLSLKIFVAKLPLFKTVSQNSFYLKMNEYDLFVDSPLKFPWVVIRFLQQWYNVCNTSCGKPIWVIIIDEWIYC